jgi:FixJ family two-component response regulator
MTAPEGAPAVIHVVDDDAAIRRALGRLLAASGYRHESHASAEDFLARHDPATIGCAIVDLSLPGVGGFAVQSRLAQDGGTFPVIFLTGTGDIEAGVRAMKGGAVDFLTKPVQAAALLDAVDRALALGAHVRAVRREGQAFETLLARLTAREREVLDAVVRGRLNKQIAGDFGISEKTIKVHRARVMEKMGVRTLAELVRLVVRHAPRDHWT